MVNNLALGVLLVDTSMRIIETNYKMREWWPEIGMAAESGQPRCHTMLPAIHGDIPCANCPVAETLRDGQVHEDMVTMTRKDGPHTFRIIASPIHGRDGRVCAAIATYGDITEKLWLARELSQAQRLEAV
jgi:hypothetical protein